MHNEVSILLEDSENCSAQIVEFEAAKQTVHF